MARPYGIYVHYPYCTHQCPYCDFAVTTDAPPNDRSYTRAVLDELSMRAPAFGGLSLRSLYLGGGTPSLWEPNEIAEVVTAAQGLGLSPGAEVTLEMNPESVDPGRLRAFSEAGVNRASVGVQSFDPGVLTKLGRRHSAQAAEKAVSLAATVFGNVSVDLIYGARRSTVEGSAEDARRAVKAGAEHVSAYALTVDVDALAVTTPFARMRREGRLPVPGDDEVRAQAKAIRSALRRSGLSRYEISNFALPGRESVHNQLYWSAESYLGVGAGAWGCLRGSPSVRWGNLRDARAFMDAVKDGRLPTAELDRFGNLAEANERLMLGLRTLAGVPFDSLTERQREEARRMIRARLAIRRPLSEGERLVLTSRGMDLHSSVSERLFET